jgi:hypothetical protein
MAGASLTVSIPAELSGMVRLSRAHVSVAGGRTWEQLGAICTSSKAIAAGPRRSSSASYVELQPSEQ